MSKKVIFFNGSPRKNGFTSKLLAEVIKGVESKGGEAKVYDLNSREIRPCTGCTRCYTKEGCSVKDYLSPMYDDIKESVAVVFGSPLYFCQMTGISKVWLDRMHPAYNGEHWEPRFPDKKFITVFAQGENDPANTYYTAGMDFVDYVFGTMSWIKVDSIRIAGTDAPGYTIPEEILKRALKAGASLID